MTPSTSLDVDADPRFQERFWVAVRVGWLVMVIILVAATLGATGGGGVLSSQSLVAGTSQIELPAVSRWAAADTMTITLSEPTARSTVTVPAAFGDTFSVDAVTPTPSSVIGSPDGDTYIFELSPQAGEVSIDFSIRAEHPVWRTRLTPFSVNGTRSAASIVTVLP